MVLRTYIIDDEAPSRRELRYLLEQIATVEVMGESSSAVTGLKGIRDQQPDLVFLDIQMPGMGGLELAQFLGMLPECPLLVFVSAYDEYALQAFELDVLDYLCKPVAQERVARTVVKAQRVLEIRRSRLGVASALPVAGGCRKISLYRGESIIPTSPARIIYARADEGEMLVQAVDGRFRSKCTLNELMAKLPQDFIQPHRSFLVNINHIREVVPWFNSSYKLIMDDRERTQIPVSRYRQQEVKRLFDI